MFHSNKKQHPWVIAWMFVSFFLVMAIIVPTTRAWGWGMSGIFLAMLCAAAIAYLVPLLCMLFKEQLTQSGISLSEWGRFMAGYPEPLVIDSFSSASQEAHDSSTSLIPYDRAETAIYDEEDQESEDEEEDDPYHQRHCLNLAIGLRPHPDEMLSGRSSIFGVPGSGKSNTVAVLCEELGVKEVPCLLADTEDEYASLVDDGRTWLPRGYLAGSPQALLEATQPLRHFIPVDQEHAFAFGQAILDQGFQIVLNLASYRQAEEAALVMIEIIRGMQAWEMAQPVEERVSCMFILDEAATWLPQKVEESILSPETLNMLQSTIFNDVVRKGRKRGIGFILATQRIAEVDKRALQSSWRFLHQQTEDIDLRRYKSILSSLEKEMVLNFEPGECIVLSPTGTYHTHIRMRYSPHGAPTPGLESITRRYGHAPLPRRRLQTQDLTTFATLSQLSVPRSDTQPQPEPTMQMHTDTLVAPLTVESAQNTPLSAQRITAQPRLSPLLERALKAWEAGEASSGRTLAAVLSVKPNTAYNLLAKLESMGLIDWRKGKSV